MKKIYLAALSLTVIAACSMVVQGQSLEQTGVSARARKFDEFTTGIGSRELWSYRNYAEQEKELKSLSHATPNI